MTDSTVLARLLPLWHTHTQLMSSHGEWLLDYKTTSFGIKKKLPLCFLCTESVAVSMHIMHRTTTGPRSECIILIASHASSGPLGISIQGKRKCARLDPVEPR